MPMSVSESLGDYAWGTECESGIFAGLRVDGQEFGASSPAHWQFALRNDSSEARTITIDHDLDRRHRYRLQVFKPGSTDLVHEFTPPLREPITTSNLARNIALGRGEVYESDIHEALIGARLKPGTYHLRIIFGGPDFNFECTSGVVEIRLK